MPSLTRLPLFLKAVRQTFVGNRLGIMERLFGKQIRSEGICWVETAPGLPWKLDLGNPCHRWMVYGDYAEPGFWSWARNHVPEDGIIVDSGANIGQFIPYFASIASEGRILAFEPSPYCQQWLQECLAVNPELCVELIPEGLGRERDRLVLENTEGAHGLWGELTRRKEIQGEEVAVNTLTNAVRSRDISQIALWKLDVEGHELEALKGAEELLTEGRIRALFVELRPENRQECIAYLQGHGYSAYEIKRGGQLRRVEEHPGGATDLLFLPRGGSR